MTGPLPPHRPVLVTGAGPELPSPCTDSVGHLDGFAVVDGSDGLMQAPRGDGSVASDGSDGYTVPARSRVLDGLLTWWTRYVSPLHERDLHLLTLWCAHTHFITEMGTTPRLAVTSPLPASGKTTVLEHLAHLALEPVHMGSVSTPAMLARILEHGPRTLLIDEVDRNLRPDREGVGDLVAILNMGYKQGGTRPVLVPAKGGEWVVREMPVFAAVAMAGISPQLPEDTLSRTLSVSLLPATGDDIEDSDWEDIAGAAADLAYDLAAWATSVELPKVDLPEWARGRAKERWRPLARVAAAAGGPWPARCLALMEHERTAAEHDKEAGLMREHPHVALLRDVATAWPPDAAAWPTPAIVDTLKMMFPERWGPSDRYPRGLTEQRLGRILSRDFGLRAERRGDGQRIGYPRDAFRDVARRLGVGGPGVTVGTVDTAQTDRPDAAPPSSRDDPQPIPAFPATPAPGPTPAGDAGNAGMESRPSQDDESTPCPHGRPGGDRPDPFVAGRLSCPECARAAS